MYARVARFEGGDVSKIDDQIAEMRRQMAAMRDEGVPEGAPAEIGVLMETVARFLQLADRETGVSVGISFSSSEEDMRRAHEALDAMSPEEGGGRRTSVEIFEVVLDESF